MTMRTILLAAVLLAEREASARDIRAPCKKHVSQIHHHVNHDQKHAEEWGTYTETGLGLCFLFHELNRDPKLVTSEMATFLVSEVLSKPGVSPNTFHHAQTEMVKAAVHFQRGNLRRKTPSFGLKPVD